MSCRVCAVGQERPEVAWGNPAHGPERQAHEAIALGAFSPTRLQGFPAGRRGRAVSSSDVRLAVRY